MQNRNGFTLAELLIALAILGVIATFTIPKILNAQQNETYNAIAKEAAGTFASAYSAYRLNNTVTASTTAGVLTPFMNYVKIDSSGLWVDDAPNSGVGPYQCSDANTMCIKLHNGAVVILDPTMSFDGTTSLNGLAFYVDPDGGSNNGSVRGPYECVVFWIFINGRLATHGTVPAGATNSNFTMGATQPNRDPTWFSW